MYISARFLFKITFISYCGKEKIPKARSAKRRSGKKCSVNLISTIFHDTHVSPGMSLNSWPHLIMEKFVSEFCKKNHRVEKMQILSLPSC